MADIESELSVEETNKRRIELGLRPIPVADGAAAPKSHVPSKEDATGPSQDESSLSLEETNKLRISLGLRPIPIPGDEGTAELSAPVPDSDEQALANWRSKYEAEKASTNLEATRKRIQKAKERIERLKYLEGRSLGEKEDDNDVDDVRKWVKRSKKKVKISIAEDDEEQEERREYTADDLKGLKVGHSLEDIVGNGAEDVILTLKDRNVLDEGEDELVSLALEERAKTVKNIENRKRKGRYTGFEDEDGLGEKKGILSRYDEDDESDKKFFTLDSEMISVGDVGSEDQKKLDAMNQGRVKVSLDIGLPPTGIIQDSSDYMPAEAIKIKKPKKAKKSKNGRKRAVEDDDGDEAGRNQDAMMVDYKPDVIEDDDEDLQALLSKQRRSLQKKRKAQFLTPEMLAQTIREQSTEGTPVPEEGEGGLVIDDMTEFVGNVGNSIAAEEEEERERKERLAISRQSSTPPIKPESDDVAMTNGHEEVQSGPDNENESDEEDFNTTGLEEEAAASTVGIGATLSMLRSRGVLKTPDEQDLERQRIQRENMQWRVSMAKHKARSELELRAQREADRKSGRYDSLTQKEREEAAQRENQMRLLVEAREAQKRFKDYKPEIKIEYKDEFGRSMSQKEAFKHLSHQFHGKGSGKGKTEKRLKKIEEERKKESSSLF
ncbi:SART-1 protein [Lipomyces orientalis]|uniref:SART-1 protein n=1 Tax=Lipomyces orientalis TaxID=1233043 RepID=A0ACC3TZB5_9ASCO